MAVTSLFESAEASNQSATSSQSIPVWSLTVPQLAIHPGFFLAVPQLYKEANVCQQSSKSSPMNAIGADGLSSEYRTRLSTDIHL